MALTNNAANLFGATPVVAAYLSANQTISNNTTTVLSFDTETYDTDNFFNTGTFRFVPVTPTATYWNIVLTVCYVDVLATYNISATIRVNGATTRGAWGAGYTGVAANTRTAVVQATALLNGSTDYIEGTFFQNSGGNITVSGTSEQYTRLCISRCV